MYDEQLRTAAFDHLTRLLDGSPDGSLASADINRFEFQGRAVPLVVQTGIWKPATHEAALPPYADVIGDDRASSLQVARHGCGALRQQSPTGGDAAERHSSTSSVSTAAYTSRGTRCGWSERPAAGEFTVAVDVGQRLVGLDALAAPQREYVRRLTNLRLHQPIFRARVLWAYGGSCAMRRLRHADLLDAAHILPDTHPRGEPVVPNGLALCKIHHAAYDRYILGVRPDLQRRRRT